MIFLCDCMIYLCDDRFSTVHGYIQTCKPSIPLYSLRVINISKSNKLTIILLTYTPTALYSPLPSLSFHPLSLYYKTAIQTRYGNGRKIRLNPHIIHCLDRVQEAPGETEPAPDSLQALPVRPPAAHHRPPPVTAAGKTSGSTPWPRMTDRLVGGGDYGGVLVVSTWQSWGFGD